MMFRTAVIALALVVGVSACSVLRATDAQRGSVVVFAASSLSTAFDALAPVFEQNNPGIRVVLNYGGSSSLATQIRQGAPADVFASAATTSMTSVSQAGLVATPVAFATNTMQIAVPPSNPANITSVTDLARPGVSVALCQPEVPCGIGAATVLANVGITVTPVTEEANVKATLAKVALGEVDAGIVYVTDVTASRGSVAGVVIPAPVNATTSYPIATISTGANPQAASAFVALVLSPTGQQVLAEQGFTRP